MELVKFRKAVGATLDDVAYAVGSHKGTISRIERYLLVPRGDLLLRINDWADTVARSKRLPVSHRLDWDHLNNPRRSA